MNELTDHITEFHGINDVDVNKFVADNHIQESAVSNDKSDTLFFFGGGLMLSFNELFIDRQTNILLLEFTGL